MRITEWLTAHQRLVDRMTLALVLAVSFWCLGAALW